MSEKNILEQPEDAARGSSPARCSAKPSCANRASQRNKLGGIYLEETHDSDNLAIALTCYFEHHMDNPQDGQEDEYGNNLWAARKVDAALERIAETIWPNDPKMSHSRETERGAQNKDTNEN